MAVAAMSAAQDKPLHSFFAKPKVPQKQQPTPHSTAASGALPGASPSSPLTPEIEHAGGDGGQKTRPRATNPAPTPFPHSESAKAHSTGRNKRRKLSLTDENHVGLHGSEHVALQPSSPPSLASPPYPDNNPDPTTPTSAPPHPDLDAATGPRSSPPPKKMLKLSAGGTLVSPVPKNHEPPPKKPAKRGRPKKEKHRIAVCRYSSNGETGRRIDDILQGSDTFELPKPRPPPTPPKPKPSKPAVFKPTHPFFSGKPSDAIQKAVSNPSVPLQNTAVTALAQSPRRPSAVTPGKLRAQAREKAASASNHATSFPHFGTGRDKTIVKQPGMMEAPFPPKGLAHVRGGFHCIATHTTNAAPLELTKKARKMKQTVPVIDPSENVLLRFQSRLKHRHKDRLRLDGFYDPPPSLRVPSRHLIPGSEIQLALRYQLGVSGSAQDTPHSARQNVHPACQTLYDTISDSLTPFDEGRSEIQAWAQKYSPKLACQVLQRGTDAIYLRDWMKALTISAVDTSSSQLPKSEKADRERKPKKKRRKKAAELDDFIVNDEMPIDDAPEELVELGDPFSSDHGRSRSFARAMNFDHPTNRSKISNSVLISGPPGCGKTAMVFAAAKELGFEVFEISPGSRRSGKDVLDKIGDMVENHLVQNHSADAGNTSADEDAGRLSDAFNKDLESGRQGTMTSFFKSKSKAESQPRKKEEVRPKLDLNQAQKALSTVRPSRGQKQSLILLEEVDIMFEEDKNFWQTIFTLLQTSKRPVVMTCNDEDLVPIQAITYQALLRLSSPPADLAVDYLLLIAGKEGHLLQRHAVSTLYNSKRQDLRASIAELQLRCQMGVGDPRGGLSWIYQRWPPGSGTDQHGQAVRVTSKDTYQPGMGFFVHDLEADCDEACDEERLRDCWETWNIDPRAKLFSKFAESDFAKETLPPKSHARIAGLEHYSSVSDSMSAVDVFCKVGMPGEDNVLLDSTLPGLPEKMRANYISGMALLQTPRIIDYSDLDTRMAVSTSCLISRIISTPLTTTPADLLSEISGSHSADSRPNALCRADFALAFDSLASQPNSSANSAIQTLSYSALDGPFGPITTDIAPYVRSIAAYDLALEAQRAALHGSAPGGGVSSKKRARTTRAARSALEGGQRQLTRRERWFDPDLDLGLVLSTAGDWPRFEAGAMEERATSPSVDTEMKMDVA